MSINDNDLGSHGQAAFSAEAHGRAALLLVESLIHGLCEKTTLSTDEAVEIAERAVDVQFDLAEAANEGAGPMRQSHTLLSSIAMSLRADARGEDGGPRFPHLVP